TQRVSSAASDVYKRQTEIAAFSKLNDEFEDRDAQILGVSIDSEFAHFQWRAQHNDLKTLPFPMLSDIKRELSQAAGVLNADGVAAVSYTHL
ncbi:redoxin domain-containing protein, partial [Enterococcus faecalis]|uniref:redoxin domain-containing protein n=1 Tax=Enterococcus faecalis TaxID=1351 RepID=UPI003B9851ED